MLQICLVEITSCKIGMLLEFIHITCPIIAKHIVILYVGPIALYCTHASQATVFDKNTC